MGSHRRGSPSRWMPATAVVSMVIAVTAGGVVAMTSASADTVGPEDFEAFSAGSPNLQSGWSRTGAFDHVIVENYPGRPASFGDKSLRISNAVTSGSFGDQTFSESLVDAAGETTADPGTTSGGARQAHFEAEWDFASADPSGEQVGLSVVASPDRGDGARMSWIQMTDTPGGLDVNFFDYRDEHPVGTAGDLAAGCSGNDDFFLTNIASGLDRTVVHSIKVEIDFLEGPRNDVARVYVDGSLVHVDTSWEDYFRYCEGTNDSRTVDSILFRTGGTAAPLTSGKGFLIDNMTTSSGPIETDDSTGEWTLFPGQSVETTTDTEVTTSYKARVRPPINADGSSNFPKRRGVIPVQFGLDSATRTVVTDTTTTGPAVFESITGDADPANDYSFLRFVPDQTVRFADINQLIANYDFTTGNCAAGSLRWQVRIDVGSDGNEANDGNVFVYFGDAPSFTDCTGAESNSGDNLIGNSDARFDLTQLGGPFYGTYADALALVGGDTALRASLVLDGGGAVDQVVDLQGANVDGATWAPEPEGTVSTVVSDTTTAFAPTCNLPAAKLRWAKNDATATGAVNEAGSIQPSDTGVYYRQVDCKYIYNLDVSTLDPNLGTRQGTYWVWVNIDGVNVQAPAKFDLR